MKFVIAMMLAATVLAFVGLDEAFAQLPEADDFTVRTDRGPFDPQPGENDEATFSVDLVEEGHISYVAGVDNLVVEVVSNTLTDALVEVPFAQPHSIIGLYPPSLAGQTDTVVYAIYDPRGPREDTETTGTITVNVHPHIGANAEPRVEPLILIEVFAGGEAIVDVNQYVTDDDPTLTLEYAFMKSTTTGLVQQGTFVESGPGIITYQAQDADTFPPGVRTLLERIEFTVSDDAVEFREGPTPGQVTFQIVRAGNVTEPDPDPVNTAPTASNGQASAQTGQTISIALADLIADAEDADSALRISISTQPASGSASVSGTNISYTAGSAAGTVTIGYTVTDTGGLTATGTIRVTVTEPTPIQPENRAPVVNIPSTPTALEAGETATIDVASYINDPDGDTLTVTITADPAQGTATIDGTVITYMAPDDAEAGTYTIGITVSDGSLSATGDVPIVIVEGNTVPIRACTR